MSPLAISSTVKLSSGNSMPLLGFGVYISMKTVPLRARWLYITAIAEAYNNEEAVGLALRNSGLKREDVFITSKIASHLYSPVENVPKIVDASLRKLGVYLYLIHDPCGGTEKRLAAYKALLEAKAEGKIRSVGVSNYSVRHLEEIREAGYELPSVNQLEVSPAVLSTEGYCRPHNAHGIVTEAFCPLLRGDFSNPVLQKIAKEVGKQVPQVLVRWSLQHGFSPLPKSANPERIVSNASVFDFELSAQQMSEIDALDQGAAGAISWNPVNSP